jgi:2'-deoxymugineic-acid 2'-dioxygenase / mugineic-acid 3-dioxygenase
VSSTYCFFVWHTRVHSEVFEKFVVQARGMGLDILQLLCESLGLRSGYFEGEQTDGNVFVSIINYPPCPNASSTLGLPPHCDRNLFTMVLSGTVPGLEVFYNGDWLKVEPVRNAFVINFGIQLEVKYIMYISTRTTSTTR